MHHLPHLGRNLLGQSERDVIIQCNVPALLIRPVKGNKGTGYVLLAGLKVLLLPGPPGAVEVRVVDVEDGVGSYSGEGVLACLFTLCKRSLEEGKGRKLTARPLVCHVPVQPPNSPVSAGVEARLRDPVKPAVIRLAHALLHGSRPRHVGEAHRREVPPHAVRVQRNAILRPQMRHQVGERPGLDATAARAVGDVPWGVNREAWGRVGEVSRNPVAIAAEAVVFVEYGRVDKVLGVESPVPVRDPTLPAAGLDLLFVEVHH